MLTLLLAIELKFGFTVAIVGYLIVFSALVLLYLIFYNIPRVYKMRIKRRKGVHGKHDTKLSPHEIPGETSAAIATALHLFFNEIHDEEDMVMTIKKVSKRYSPWSSKIYGLNNYYYSQK